MIAQKYRKRSYLSLEEDSMQLQQIKQLAGAMDALSSCVEINALLTMLLIQAKELCRAEAAWSWLMGDADQLRLQQIEGVPSTVPPHLQRMKMPAGGQRVIARRLRRIGYRSVLVVPLQAGTRILGIVAVGSRRSRQLRRVDAAACAILAQHAGILIGTLQGHPPLVSGGAPPHEELPGNRELAREHIHLLNALIARITHGLNNIMATINGRVELLLNRPYDQSTMQHLGSTLRAIIEANQLVRHIQNLVSGQRGQEVVMVDLNQLVRDCVQIARSTWFMEFRARRVSVELTADLRPTPALPTRAPELRIALLCLLRHAMDTLDPGGRLVIRTWTEGEDERETVLIRLFDESGQPPEVAQTPAVGGEEGIGSLLDSAHATESTRMLDFVETTVHHLGGRITVYRNATGGIIITLRFSRSDVPSYEG
jgi:signal transduction histidine kinase